MKKIGKFFVRLARKGNQTIDITAAPRKKAKKMARETGIEPATSTVTGWYSNQLSYSPAQLKLTISVSQYS